jgi:hypothetical protein
VARIAFRRNAISHSVIGLNATLDCVHAGKRDRWQGLRFVEQRSLACLTPDGVAEASGPLKPISKFAGFVSGIRSSHRRDAKRRVGVWPFSVLENGLVRRRCFPPRKHKNGDPREEGPPLF